MVIFDSEYICARCKRRIKEGREVWILDIVYRILRPYGSECARIIRSKDKQIPEHSAPGLQTDVDFECFRTTGISELEEKE